MMTEQDMIKLLRIWQLVLKNVVHPDRLWMVGALSNVVQYIKEKAWDEGLTIEEYPEKEDNYAKTFSNE